MTKDITVKKAQDMLLKDEERLSADFKAYTLIICCHSDGADEAGSCWHCSKIGYKKDLC